MQGVDTHHPCVGKFIVVSKENLLDSMFSIINPIIPQNVYKCMIPDFLKHLIFLAFSWFLAVSWFNHYTLHVFTILKL